jgi:hypothetical protein
MNIDKTMMSFDEAQQKIQEAIRSKEPFVVGTSKRVSRLNDKVIIISEKDFNDVFPESSDKCVFVNER